MKLNPEHRKYLWLGLTAYLVFLACMGAYFLVFHLGTLFDLLGGLITFSIPIVDGILIAFFLTPLLNGLERRAVMPLWKRFGFSAGEKSKGRIRALSLLLTFFVVFLVAYLLTILIIPQMITSVRYIGARLNDYQQSLTKIFSEFLQSRPALQEQVNQMLERLTETSSELFERYFNFQTLTDLTQVNFVQAMLTGLLNFFRGVWNFVIGAVISVYILFSKEIFAAQAKKLLFALFHQDRASLVIQAARSTHRTFVGFIVGKLLDSLIIGIICFIVVSILGMPFTVLISVIVGVTNVIPFFGPFLGAIPCLVLIFVENPMQCPVFLLAILAIQQFDGNILGPKILGDSTGLPGFWVIFAITFFGGIWGIPGMFFGTPAFAVIYKGVHFIANRLLEKRKMPKSTTAYLQLEEEKKGDYLIYTPVPETPDQKAEKDIETR